MLELQWENTRSSSKPLLLVPGKTAALGVSPKHPFPGETSKDTENAQNFRRVDKKMEECLAATAGLEVQYKKIAAPGRLFLKMILIST